MILIYSSTISNRLRYILQFIFEDVCQKSIEFTSDIQYFSSYNGAKINYSRSRITEQELYINPAGLLQEDTIHPIEIEVKRENGKLYLFPDANSDTFFDVFSAIFYLVSRYEEYLPFNKDKHGRFEAEESFAYKHQFLDRPIVDEWIIDLQNLLSSKFSQLTWSKREFTFIPTIDIDQAFKYKGKSLLRISKALFMTLFSFKWNEFINILSIYFGYRKDPFDKFDTFEKLHSIYHLKAIYFFLFSKKYNKYDINISIQNKEFRNRIRFVAKTAQVGIHPSYQSRYDFKIIDAEIHQLSNVLNVPINSSRQHYLKLRMPNTYKSLISLGIANEYSMGYASMPGFRASTTHSFRFFDLKHEQVSFLKIHPFCVMDATFTTYLKCTEEEAFAYIENLMNNVKKVNGTFISLWHNESMSGEANWKGWEGLYEKMLKKINDLRLTINN